MSTICGVETAFLLILCHELGHYFGGAPKIPRGNTGKFSWSSAEGQADYYASSKCLKSIFVDSKANKRVVENIPLNIKSKLSKVCDTDQCKRIAYAGYVTSLIFADITRHPFDIDPLSPDQEVVPYMNYNHPNPQCRFDTLLAGAQCEKDSHLPFDDQDPFVGACIRKSYTSWFNRTPKGVRPLCWFHPETFR